MPFHSADPQFTYIDPTIHKTFTIGTYGANDIKFPDTPATIPSFQVPSYIKPSFTMAELHGLWDAADAAYQSVLSPINPLWANPKYRKAYLKYINTQANYIYNKFYQDSTANHFIYDPHYIEVEMWAAQAAQKACFAMSSSKFKLTYQPYKDANSNFWVKLTFKEGGKGVKKYMAATQSVAREQIYLAGMRLANLLNAVYAPKAAVTNPAYVSYLKKDIAKVEPLAKLIEDQ